MKGSPFFRLWAEFLSESWWCTADNKRRFVNISFLIFLIRGANDSNFRFLFVGNSNQHCNFLGFSWNEAFCVIYWINPNAQIITVVLLSELNWLWEMNVWQILVISLNLALIFDVFLANYFNGRVVFADSLGEHSLYFIISLSDRVIDSFHECLYLTVLKWIFDDLASLEG